MEIKISTFGMNNAPCFSIEGAVVVSKEEEKSGTNANGVPWRLLNAVVKLQLLEETSDFIKVTFRSKILEKMGGSAGLQIQGKYNLKVRFGTSGSKWVTTDVNVVDIEKA